VAKANLFSNISPSGDFLRRAEWYYESRVGLYRPR